MSWTDLALGVCIAIAVCAMAQCQIKRESNWRDIEIKKLEMTKPCS